MTLPPVVGVLIFTDGGRQAFRGMCRNGCVEVGLVGGDAAVRVVQCRIREARGPSVLYYTRAACCFFFCASRGCVVCTRTCALRCVRWYSCGFLSFESL